MRKIEEQMIEAIRQRKNWSSGNTTVSPYSCGVDIWLHGNHIATHWMPGTEQGEMIPNRGTFRSWPTRTTVSRLRALGINASVRKGKAMIDGMEV